jgi:hypothetical protein
MQSKVCKVKDQLGETDKGVLDAAGQAGDKNKHYL